MKLDINKGDVIAWHGYDVIVMALDEDGAVLKFPNEPNEEEFYAFNELIAEQNPELVLDEEE